MTRNFKLYFKYLFFNTPHFYLQQSKRGSQNTSVVIAKPVLYFSALHIRFSSLFYLTQLGDIFAYELPVVGSRNSPTDSSLPINSTTESYLVYNFHNLMFQDRFFFFCIDTHTPLKGSLVNSIAEIFPNASWLEREVSELHGVVFNNKKDIRNLMLQYGDTTTPFQKSAPSIGFKEVYYDTVSDVLLETPITLQA
jgi:NADH:ubiquinone oxidoreductase subunit C